MSTDETCRKCRARTAWGVDWLCDGCRAGAITYRLEAHVVSPDGPGIMLHRIAEALKAGGLQVTWSQVTVPAELQENK